MRPAGTRLIFCAHDFAQDDGTVISTVDQDGSVLDATFDLYNQAFALLACACGHGALDPSGDWQSRGYALVETLRRGFVHQGGGFRDDPERRLPLRANPHMHLLEAALAWLAIDPSPVWRDLADEIVALCRDRFIDRDTGALRELFASDWTPVSGTLGEIPEPGHHYEWASLLDRWAKRTDRSRPAEVSKLIAFADAKGLDRKRRVAVNGIKLDGSLPTRSRGFGRRPSGPVPTLSTVTTATKRGCEKPSKACRCISMHRFQVYGMKTSLPMASVSSKPQRRRACITLSARSANSGRALGHKRFSPLSLIERRWRRARCNRNP